MPTEDHNDDWKNMTDKKRMRFCHTTKLDISALPQGLETEDDETRKQATSSDATVNADISVAIEETRIVEADRSTTPSPMDFTFNCNDDEEPSHRHIDWSAPPIDPDSAAYDEIEPPPPANRAIYPLMHQNGWKVIVTPPNPDWPRQFNSIADHIHNVLTTSNPPIPYTTIEHIGSTSIPNLSAKPNIDVLVTLDSHSALLAALDAFLWEIPTRPPFTRYSLIPDGGGIQGRESLKLYVPQSSPYHASTPQRSVYLVWDSPLNRAGQVAIRGYRSVKTTLTDPRNLDLLREYESTKLELTTRIFENSIDYASEKDGIIRKILKRAGWTDEEMDEKDRFSVRHVLVHDLPY